MHCKSLVTVPVKVGKILQCDLISGQKASDKRKCI